MEHLARLQSLLKDLFQLDTADLDFGIYRLYHIKRDELDAFIEEQIPASVRQAFSAVEEAQKMALREDVEELEQRIRTEMDEDPFTSDGDVREEYRQLPIKSLRETIGAYEPLRDQLAEVQATEAQQIEVFNHLYRFFQRYYEDGDFISKRRYGAHETYAVPYDGQEVYLHWANKDQHYVKSAEQLRDYAFSLEALGGPYRVRYRLVEATQSPDNTKGDARYFFPQTDRVHYEDKTLTVPFEYRLPTAEEEDHHGKNAKGQDHILLEALDAILEAVPEDNLALALKEIVRETDKERVCLLLHRLRHFTRKQTSDYFVHKDLRGFLQRELEFYIKDQVLHLADIQSDLTAKLRTIQVFRQVAEDIITFLDQLERVQCRLFEKKKFVLSTHYLCPIQHVPQELWPDVLDNAPQRAAWHELFAIEEPLDEGFLQAHPTLVVNTAHFDSGFQDRLLAAFEDIDEATDGLLVHGENYQALNSFIEQYRGQIACVHIDPPYNTDTSGFMYKNAYKHSSWLTMMTERASQAAAMLTPEGSFLCHIDENEFERIQFAFDTLGLVDNGAIVWDKRNPMLGKKGIATQHEYICWRVFETRRVYRGDSTVRLILDKAKSLISENEDDMDTAREAFAQWISTHPGLSGGERAYRYLDEDGQVYQSVSLGAPEMRTNSKFFQPLIHPITNKPCPVPANGWSRAPETIEGLLERGEVLFGSDEMFCSRRKWNFSQI